MEALCGCADWREIGCAGAALLQAEERGVTAAAAQEIVVLAAFDLAGTGAIYEAHPLQRFLRDALVPAQHAMLASNTYEAAGAVLLEHLVAGVESGGAGAPVLVERQAALLEVALLAALGLGLFVAVLLTLALQLVGVLGRFQLAPALHLGGPLLLPSQELGVLTLPAQALALLLTA